MRSALPGSSRANSQIRIMAINARQISSGRSPRVTPISAPMPAPSRLAITRIADEASDQAKIPAAARALPKPRPRARPSPLEPVIAVNDEQGADGGLQGKHAGLNQAFFRAFTRAPESIAAVSSVLFQFKVRERCSRMSQYVPMATTADAGMVRIQAQTIRCATPHRTAESRCAAPTPMITPVMVWVVRTGMPAIAVPKSVMAPAVSAQKPPMGLSFVMREPMVCTMVPIPPK